MITSWSIWKSRCTLVFEHKQPSTTHLLEKIHKAATEMNIFNSYRVAQGRTPTNDRWTRPDNNTIKINCDASRCPVTGQGGIGVIARGQDRHICGGWHGASNEGSIEELEAKAVLHAVQLAVEKRWPRTVIESDSEIVIDHLKGTTYLWRIDTILSNAKILASNIKAVDWIAIPRTVNACAD